MWSRNFGRKRKYTLLLALAIFCLFAAACRKEERLPVSLPENYAVNKALYLMEGEGIYVLIANDVVDCEAVNSELCSGNAQTVKEEYEKKETSDPAAYVAIQNVLGIAEVYLGNYESSCQYFNAAIEFLDEVEIPEKNDMLTVLLNNGGNATVNLPTALEDEQLQQALELNDDPYMDLVICVNQTGRITTHATEKEIGEQIAEATELTECEKMIESSPGFVGCLAAKNRGACFAALGQYDKALEVLDEWVPKIPDTAEYNMIRSTTLSMRGYVYQEKKEYVKAEEDLKTAIECAEKTVNEKSLRLAVSYMRLAFGYQASKEWETALFYLKKGEPGYQHVFSGTKALFYYEMGYVYWELGDLKASKDCFLKAYVNIPENNTDPNTEFMLHAIYMEEEHGDKGFQEWLEEEVQNLEE